MRSAAARWRDDRAETLVEFALAAAMYFTIIFGTIEFGLAVWRFNMVSDLAQEGARWASVRGATSAAIAHASATDVANFVQSRAAGLPVTVTTPLGAPSTLFPSQTVEVRVRTTYQPLTALLPTATLNLESTAQMVMSR